MMAISAVDKTLGDLRGRYFNAPVYRLLGGPTRAQIPAYASTLGYSIEPGRGTNIGVVQTPAVIEHALDPNLMENAVADVIERDREISRPEMKCAVEK